MTLKTKPLKQQVKDCLKLIGEQSDKITAQGNEIAKLIYLRNERADGAEKKLANVRTTKDWWENECDVVMKLWREEVIQWQGIVLLSIAFNILVIASIIWKWF